MMATRNDGSDRDPLHSGNVGSLAACNEGITSKQATREGLHHASSCQNLPSQRQVALNLLVPALVLNLPLSPALSRLELQCC